MKKFIFIITIIVSLFTLSACISSNETKTYQYEKKDKSGTVFLYTFKIKGDKVLSQTSDNTISIDEIMKNDGIDPNTLSQEETTNYVNSLKDQINSEISKNPKIKGYSDTFKIENRVIKEKVSLDYTKVDNLADLQKISGFSGDTSKGSFISWKKTKKLIIDQGFKEKNNSSF